MSKKWIAIILQGLFFMQGWTQEKLYHASVEAQGIYTSNNTVPFWFRSNQFGSVPLPGTSLSLIGRVEKTYDTTEKKLFDWGAAVEERLNIGSRVQGILTEGYAKMRVSVFQLKVGRSKEIMGLTDSLLSTGSFSISGNTLGIPKVEISIPEFYSLPFFDKLFALKGNYAHGWFGSLNVTDVSLVPTNTTYLHQKSLYGRIGKPQWKWKLYGGFNHQVFWGNEKNMFGSKWTLTPWETYWYVVFGKSYGNSDIARSKVGNHLGSIDLGFEWQFKNFRLLAYRQNFYDEGALFHLANLADGLNGISFVNNKKYDKGFHWQRILFELLYTKNQAGETGSKVVPSGDENYYNNYIYAQGYSYKEEPLGFPFAATRKYTRAGLVNDPQDYFINNRIVAFHFGYLGNIEKWQFLSKLSVSKNYGTFGTSEPGHSRGSTHFPPAYGLFGEVDQFSAYFEANKEFWSGLRLGCAAAFDVGKLYYNSGGIILKATKSF